MRNRRGISLIVLVITIIVMLVLAGAVIITLSNSSIITKAKDAVNKTNEKTLEQQADIYASELMLEFRQLGLGNAKLPSHSRQVYKDALKEGKTEEEARQFAQDSFVGSYYNWEFFDYPEGSQIKDFINGWFTGLNYTPMYLEVKRVVDIIYDDEDGKDIVYEIDTTLVPKDLQDNIKELYKINEKYWEDGADNAASIAFEEAWQQIQPLYGFYNKDPENKYADQILPIVHFPYYIYTDAAENKIVKMNEYQNTYPTNPPRINFSEIRTLVVDENYTSLSNVILPPVGNGCNIILPETVKVIGKNVFMKAAVKKLVIPSSVETIEEGAFGTRGGAFGHMTELVIKKEKGSIPGEPWGLNTAKTTIIWEP